MDSGLDHHYVGSMPYDRQGNLSPYAQITDPSTLRRLLEASLLLESNLELNALLTHIVEEALSLANARYGALGVLDETGHEVVEFVVSGLYPDQEEALLKGPLPTGKGVFSVLMDDPHPTRIKVIADHPASVGFPPGHPPMTSFLGAPIRTRNSIYGNIYLTDKIGADEFTQDDQAVIEALSLAAGIAVENARLHLRAGEIAVYEERDRMARDLHDGVIQRLFAIGLSLQGLTAGQTDRAAADSIGAVVEDIDETIRQVRATIFELSRPGGDEGIRARVLALIDEMQVVLGFNIAIDFAGPVDAAVSDEVAEQLLATLREGLSNVARHAHATQASVSLSLAGRDCRLEIRDNGHGFVGGPAAGSGLGLANLRSRAEDLGGSFEVLHPPEGGTTLAWQVPAFRRVLSVGR